MKKNAFGLLEVLLSVAIIVMVIAGVGTLNSYSVKTSELNLRRTVAYNLAQEGLELVRKERDSNFLSSQNWNNNLINPSFSFTDRLVDGVSFSRTVTQSTVQPDPGIQIEIGDQANYVLINSVVTWQEYGRSWKTEASAIMTNWKTL